MLKKISMASSKNQATENRHNMLRCELLGTEYNYEIMYNYLSIGA